MAEPLFPHENATSFRDMVRYVEGKTGFSARLIEKDYYCSIVLRALAKAGSKLVFKGGTLLNKVHAGFYRLSEDLDFTVSVEPGGPRADRSRKAQPFKDQFARLPQEIPRIQLEKPLKGSNLSTQYNGTIAYGSVLIEKQESVSVEISLREKVHDPVTLQAATLLEDPFTGVSMVPKFDVICLSRNEAYAEKVRAALMRKDAAIRDLYDLHHAITHKLIRLDDNSWLKLVAEKCKVSDDTVILISDERKANFHSQLETQLKPVLREREFVGFDFEQAWKQLIKMVEMVSSLFSIT